MDRYLVQKANANSGKLFKAKPNRSQLHLSVIEKLQRGNGKWALHVQPQREIDQAEELERVREVGNYIMMKERRADTAQQAFSECARIYTIHHARAWTTLDISRELFDQLIGIHEVFPELWKVVLTFGIKQYESEYGIPTPQSRESRSGSTISRELGYVIRRVEPNGRALPACPWSIRQTGVYHKSVRLGEMSRDPVSVFLLVAPSSAAETDILEVLSTATSNNSDAVSVAFQAHKTLVAESLTGWMDYMSWLEYQLKINSIWMVGTTEYGDRTMSLVEEDRRNLKELEDFITNLIVILHTKVQTIRRLKTSCEKACTVHCVRGGACPCRQVVEEFKEYAAEAEAYHERASVLQSQAHALRSLSSDLLGYEEARALRELATASQKESAVIRELAKRGFQDTIAVRSLTVIGLLFMPITLVLNFFSTEFVKADGGELRVSRWAWLILGVAVVLSGIVFLGWKSWLRYERFRIRSEQADLFGNKNVESKEAVLLGA
ncbi:hypothetical protein BJX99DRAFT_262972 [Aspergillus californicus]